MTVRKVHVARAQEVAIMVHASSATVSDTFIANTQPTAGGRFGRAINVQTDTVDQIPSVTITGSIIDGAYDAGIVGSTGSIVVDRTARETGVLSVGSTSVLERVVVRDMVGSQV